MMWTCVPMIAVPTSRVIEAQAQHPGADEGCILLHTGCDLLQNPLVWTSTLVSQQLAKTIDTYDQLLYIDNQRELAKGYQNDQAREG
jgi:hypothetical protein